jgi:hypothetical protein
MGQGGPLAAGAAVAEAMAKETKALLEGDDAGLGRVQPQPQIGQFPRCQLARLLGPLSLGAT